MKTLSRTLTQTLTAGALLLLAAQFGVDQTPATAQSTTGFMKEFGTMWTFEAAPLDYWEETYGFRPTQDWLDHIRLSSLRIPGCSASFVSADGLIMTNHHCSRGCIARVSPPEVSYMETGFVAETRADEIQCPGMWADQFQSSEDVTARVQNALTATDPQLQAQQRDSIVDLIGTECGDETGLTCQVVSLYQGGMYSLYKYRRFNDVRLAIAPEYQAAAFGGDPDNFTYPRFDLDVTMLRVYEDGAPVEPDHYLEFSEAGAGEGEPVFIVGNPGSTGRLLTQAQMEFLRDHQYPGTLASYERRLAVNRTLAARSPEDFRRLQNTILGLENSHKAVSGYLRGLLDEDRMAKKAAFEADFRRRVDADSQLRAQYGGAWDAIADAQAELASFDAQNRFYGFGGSGILGMAGNLVRLPAQALLPDSLRLGGFRGNGLERIRGQLLADQTFEMEAEVMNLTAQLEAARAALPASDPFLRTMLGGRSPEAAARALLEGTGLADTGSAQALVEGGAAAIASSSDPMIVAAREIDGLAAGVAQRAAPLNAAIAANAQLVGQAIFAAYGHSLPPDATFTLRITDGVVKRYPNNGTFAPYKTSFYGLFARAAEFDNEPPWNLAQSWVDARDELDMTTPMNFVSTNDIIGGNSGSPVINREAQVVGLVFDGNIEFLPNRFIFMDEVERTVSVHSSAILEAFLKVYDAQRIYDELTGGR